MDGAKSLTDWYSCAGPEARLEWILSEYDASQVLFTTSGGIQSGMLLTYLSECKRESDVFEQPQIVLVDTGDLFLESLRYVEELSAFLNLRVLRVSHGLSLENLRGSLAQLKEIGFDEVEGFDYLSKVIPLRAFIRKFGIKAWVSGLRRDQAPSRKELPLSRREDSIICFYPLADCSREFVINQLTEKGIPLHPLQDLYSSVGNVMESEPFRDDVAFEKAGRHRGRRQECGLHMPWPNQAIANWIFREFGSLDNYPIFAREDLQTTFSMNPLPLGMDPR